jgi:lactonase family protein with 7-bladed beta-propeller
MRMLRTWLQVISGVVAFALFAADCQAQQYIFTNDNGVGSKNTTTALALRKGGLAVLKTYLTGGKSAGSAYYALSPIAFARVRAGYCLFVSNGGDSTVAAFQANLFDGRLTGVRGSPFADGMSGAQNLGIGLAVGSNRLLFAGNTNTNNISVFQINGSCSLKVLQKMTVPGSPAGMKVTPDGKYLLVAYIGQVDSFAIDYATGVLTELGPFKTQGAAAGVEISCDSTTAYFGDTASNTQVEVFSINSSGGLKEIDNFTTKHGQSSNNVLLSVDGKHLYVSNTVSNEITTLSVASNGGLTYDSTVKLKKPGLYALGLGTGTSGLDIFVSEENNTEAIGVLTPNGGTLTEIAGSPFHVMKNGNDPAGLTLVPPKTCR